MGQSHPFTPQWPSSPASYQPVPLQGFLNAYQSLWGGIGAPTPGMNNFINNQAGLMPLFQMGMAMMLQNMLVHMMAQGMGQRSPGRSNFGRWPSSGFRNSRAAPGWSGNRTPSVTMNPTGPAGVANQSALAAARSQLGVREATGRNDGIPAQRYSNGRREPWCANFVAWSFRQAGKQLPGNQRSLASVQYMEDQMKKAGRFHRGVPKPGDIIFFKNRGNSDRGGGRHVGIVERVANGRVYTIEGNSSNAVRRRSYPLNHWRISGYGR